jgi:threonine dehydratase
MIKLSDIFRAQNTIQRHATRTPLVPAFSLSDENCDVRLKLETTQPIGAFKLRGAFNALSRLTETQRQRGVVCASTGNHGRALAYAAAQLGCKATICMSTLVPENKVDAVRKLGAEVIIHGNSQDDAQHQVERLVKDHGMSEIPPFDHADIIAGQGTIALEILEDWPEVDTILVGLSGGGLLGGIALTAKSIDPDIRIIGFSPKRGAAMAASLAAGHAVEVEELPTLADSLGGGIGLDNRFTFDLVQRHMDQLVLLDEAQIANAMRHLYFHENLVSEGAGAVGVSALIDAQVQGQLGAVLGRRIAIIISGHNVDMPRFNRIMAGANE